MVRVMLIPGMDIPLFRLLYFLLHLYLLIPNIVALDFIFNSFNTATNLTLINDTYVETSIIRMTKASDQYSSGKVFYPTKLPVIKPISNSSNITSFSTSFIFSILQANLDKPGYGLAFVLCNTTSPPGSIDSNYFGLFGTQNSTVFPLLVVEFDTGYNPEVDDLDNNHIGIDLNDVASIKQTTAGYYSSTGNFESVDMRNGKNIRAWIEFDGANLEINVTVAPIGVSRPSKPTLSYRDPIIASYLYPEMFVGFSASKTNWVEAQRVLAWSFSDSGTAKELNTMKSPVFKQKSPPLSGEAISGIVVSCFVFVCFASAFVLWRFIGLKF